MFANFKFGRRRSAEKKVNEKMTGTVATVLEINLSSPLDSANNSPLESPEPSPTEDKTHEPVRKQSVSALGNLFRRGSVDQQSTRNQSVSSHRLPFWESSNPDVDSMDPPRGASVSSQTSNPSPSTSRRPSYVPRNAASSFRRTTTPLEHINTDSTTAPVSTRRGSVNVAGRTHSVAASRRPSMASTTSDASRSTSLSAARRSSVAAHIADRRPSLAAQLDGRRPSLAPSHSSSSSDDARRSGSFARHSRGSSSDWVTPRSGSFGGTARSGSLSATRVMSLSSVAEKPVRSSPRPAVPAVNLEALGFSGAVPVSAR